mgnify:CR=1 FL=1
MKKPFEAKKLYYTIGEVSKITGLPAYLLRSWENEFSQLTPSRNAKGNRIYTNKDISNILSIKNLVYDQGYTLERAKALMLGHDASPDQVEATNQLLKAHQTSIKEQIQANQDKRREALLEAKAVFEDLLKRFQ